MPCYLIFLQVACAFKLLFEFTVSSIDGYLVVLVGCLYLVIRIHCLVVLLASLCLSLLFTVSSIDGQLLSIVGCPVPYLNSL